MVFYYSSQSRLRHHSFHSNSKGVSPPHQVLSREMIDSARSDSFSSGIRKALIPLPRYRLVLECSVYCQQFVLSLFSPIVADLLPLFYTCHVQAFFQVLGDISKNKGRFLTLWSLYSSTIVGDDNQLKSSSIIKGDKCYRGKVE